VTNDTRDSGGRRDAPPEVHFEDDGEDLSALSWVDAPGILVFWVLAIVVFLQFFTRYVLNDSLAWTEEVARYLLILVAFLGSVTAVRRGAHIMLEFTIRALPPRWGKVLAVISEAITMLFYGGLTWIGIELLQKTRQQLVTIPVPKSWIYAVCVASLGVMTVYSARWLWRKLRATPEQVVATFDPSRAHTE
jgi:TRAP-type C4-dicarboxylate transport system permease small subunit